MSYHHRNEILEFLFSFFGPVAGLLVDCVKSLFDWTPAEGDSIVGFLIGKIGSLFVILFCLVALVLLGWLLLSRIGYYL